MQEYPKWVATVQTVWLAIGAILIFGGESFGLNLPPFLLQVFSEEGWSITFQVIGAILAFIQFIRVAIQAKKDGTEMEVASASSGRVSKYLINPFKLAA